MKKLLGIMLCSFFMLTGCGNVSNTQTDESGTATAQNKSAVQLQGTITMSGSTSMEKLCTALNEYFMQANPGVTANAEYIGSGAGIEAVTAGTVEIGNASRALKEEEKANGVVENIVAIDGVGVIVNGSNTINDLTKDQLTQIYSGQIKNWSELGGNDCEVVVIGREAGSGTRGAFEELIGLEDKCAYAQELNSTGAVLPKVESVEGAIGYVSLDVLNEESDVKLLTLDGVEASAENIKAGTYFLSRPFVMVTKGEISQQSEIVKAYFDYINSEEGQSVIEQLGLISAK